MSRIKMTDTMRDDFEEFRVDDDTDALRDELQECRADDDTDTLGLRDEFEEFRARSYSGGFLLLEWPNSRQQLTSTSEGDITETGISGLTLKNYSKSSDVIGGNVSAHAQDEKEHRHVVQIEHPGARRNSGLVPDQKLVDRQRLGASHGGRLNGVEDEDEIRRKLCSRKKASLPVSFDTRLNSNHVESLLKQSGHISRNSKHCDNDNHAEREANTKLDRSRHLSLKQNSPPSSRRSRDAPPSIQVSVHRQVSSRAPVEWDLEEQETYWQMGMMRPRVFSLPNGPLYRPRLSTISSLRESRLNRLRSFTITRKGIRKEYKEISNSSLCSCDIDKSGSGSVTPQDHRTLAHSGDCAAAQCYKVVLLGQHNVGKRAIIKRFVAEKDTSYSFDDDTYRSVSILLDGEESTMEFVDTSDTQVDQRSGQDPIDAYVVVYSVEDRRSFEATINRLYEIREADGKMVALILVANKTDLVRSRSIQEEEGKAAAHTYDCKYIEVSAAIDHNVDELLVGVLKQIRLIKKKYHKCKAGWRFGRDPGNFFDNCCLLQARENVLSKIFRSDRGTSKSTDNLFVL